MSRKVETEDTRAFSVLAIKSIDEDQRKIIGIATTPSPDRMDDIVEPRGAEYTLPLPFLWQHDKTQPIGHVTKAIVTDAGIEVEIELAKIDEPGTLKDRIDEAWQSIKAGLVRGLSIGFQPKEYTEIAGSWGLRFVRWMWFELSAVTIPANAEATITSVKTFDLEQRAKMLGRAAKVEGDPVTAPGNPPAGATATVVPPIIKQPDAPTGAGIMTLAEQINAAQEARKVKADSMANIIKTAGDNTLGTEQQKEFNGLKSEVDQLDQHISNLKALEQIELATAKSVSTEQPNGAGVVVTKSVTVEPTVKVGALEKGIGIARAIRYLSLAKGDWARAEVIAKRNSNEHPRVIEFIERAAVPAGTTTNSTWGAPLVNPDGGIVADFIEFLRPQTILGRFGQGGIPALNRVPFRVSLVSQTSGGSASWVGEAKAKPVTKFDFARTHLDPLKIAAIAVITKELMSDSSPAADVLVRNALVAACRERQDTDFVDPNKALVANVSPASITNGVVPIAASGTDADAVRVDVRKVMAQFIAARNLPSSGVWIMDSLTAYGISSLRKALTNEPEFPGLTVLGGTFEGMPVIVSDYAPRNSNGGTMILVNASDIYYGDDGDFTVDFSTEASLVMDSAPSMNSDTPTAAQVVSMFQTNSVAFLAERRLDWMKRRAQSVSWVQNTNYGA